MEGSWLIRYKTATLLHAHRPPLNWFTNRLTAPLDAAAAPSALAASHLECSLLPLLTPIGQRVPLAELKRLPQLLLLAYPSCVTPTPVSRAYSCLARCKLDSSQHWLALLLINKQAHKPITKPADGLGTPPRCANAAEHVSAVCGGTNTS